MPWAVGGSSINVSTHAPVKARRQALRLAQGRHAVSTHAPVKARREGGDFHVPHVIVSTHAPVKARLSDLIDGVTWLLFQPTRL